VAVDVGCHHITIDLLERRVDHMGSGAMTAAIQPLSSMLTFVISAPRAADASRACAKGMMSSSDQRGILAQRVAHHHVRAQSHIRF
jgi:hypothetical protein